MTATVKKLTGRIRGFAVRRADEAAPVPQSETTTHEPDRRLTLKPAEGVAEGSLRWPSRPHTPQGVDARVYYVRVDESERFIVTISHYANGTNHPFEVYVHGAEAFRGAEALAKLLSKVMQTKDRRFLEYNLNALKKVKAHAFDLVLPNEAGEVVRVPSRTAAVARLVEFRARELGYLDDSVARDASPMLAAMTSLKEPKTQGQGGLSHYEDIKNQRNEHSADDFTVFVKEAMLGGARFPFSVWASGDFEHEWEGIFKLLSIGMRLSDPKWVAMLLRQLREIPERDAFLFAPVPREGKQRTYPSTLAYVAEVLLARYRELGILDADGEPLRQARLFAVPATAVSSERPAPAGLLCPSCSTYAMRHEGGCPTCSACGYSKC